MKYCEDCKWLDAAEDCGHTSALKPPEARPDLVRRGINAAPTHYSASIQRGDFALANQCGPDARFFEAKP